MFGKVDELISSVGSLLLELQRLHWVTCVQFGNKLPRLELIMEQLQLQVESRLFKQDEMGLAEMIELLGIDHDLAGKSKMKRIKIIRKTIDSKMAGDEKEA